MTSKEMITMLRSTNLITVYSVVNFNDDTNVEFCIGFNSPFHKSVVNMLKRYCDGITEFETFAMFWFCDGMILLEY